MANQVTGSDRTLVEAIRHGEVERPPLMGWNDFQVWRRDHGKRPTQAVDGFSTETTVETALWRAVMLDLYGDDWSIRIAAGETGIVAPQPISQSSLIITIPICGYLKFFFLSGRNPKPFFPIIQLSLSLINI